MKFITEKNLPIRPNWQHLVEAISSGHKLSRPYIDDVFQGNDNVTLLSRTAFIEGLGCGTKAVTVSSENANKGLPTVQGAMLFFEPENASPIALVDSDLITKWKTAADSVLGADLLARPDPKTLLIIGAGKVAESLADAYTSYFPSIEKIWVYNRTAERGEKLVSRLKANKLPAEFTADLPSTCPNADIVCSATMSKEPILMGSWIKPGTHIDLIGAFKSDMREADDNLLKIGNIFVDSRETAIDHIGELKIPLTAGVIQRNDIKGDLYDLLSGEVGRKTKDDITIYKNGGGAHLDLMTAKYLIDLEYSK